MVEGSKSDATLSALQRVLEEIVELSGNRHRADEAAVATMMSAARDLSDEPQDLRELEARNAAMETALSILAANPVTGPVVIKYVGSDEDVPDERFLIVLFGDKG